MEIRRRRLNLLNVNQLLLNQGRIASSYAITPGDYLASHWGTWGFTAAAEKTFQFGMTKWNSKKQGWQPNVTIP